MSRILLTTWPGGGSVPPMLNLGVRLSRRGHDVLTVGWDAMARQVAAHGLAFTGCPSLPAWPDGLPFDDDLDRLRGLLHGSEAEEDILRAAAGFEPEVVVVDCMMSSAFRAANRLGARSAIRTTCSTGTTPRTSTRSPRASRCPTRTWCWR
jgi:UDP:flavonoid glycosyltransferase YjiC (YdhE family)